MSSPDLPPNTPPVTHAGLTDEAKAQQVHPDLPPGCEPPTPATEDRPVQDPLEQ